ncbi:MAG TPA: hypothetical protein VHM90_15680 [Phycisphaerae bacterium]|nr:hypothetical protein [Phycisphaerae bacterium]
MELASLAADDPQRQAFAQRVAGMPPAERARWEAEFALTDRLRADLADVAVPPGLETRLLAAPGAEPQPAEGTKRGFRIFGMSGRLAAALVILAGVLAYYLLFMASDAGTPGYLDTAVANKIVAVAIERQPAAPALASSDVETVKKALESGGVDVPVIMLTPEPGTSLVGGGTCDFAGTRAAYTQWKNGESKYTLYEFDGKKLGAPKNFYSQLAGPTSATGVHLSRRAGQVLLGLGHGLGDREKCLCAVWICVLM